MAWALGLGLLAVSCKRNHPAPAGAGAPAPADSATESARSGRFESELQRAHGRWQESPNLGNCSDVLPEQADAGLCSAAAASLSAVEALDAAAASSVALPALADASLALERLLERARYLSLEELGRRRLEGDAGAAALGSAAASSVRAAPPTAPTALAARPNAPRGLQNLLRDRAKLKLSESPVARLVQNAARVERDVLRNFAAYLEYAPLPIRKAALDTATRLQAEHPHWPTLSHTLREAAVLETDPTLKQSLLDAASHGFPPSKRPDQPTGSK